MTVEAQQFKTQGNPSTSFSRSGFQHFWGVSCKCFGFRISGSGSGFLKQGLLEVRNNQECYDNPSMITV